ncbi:hypothetical protein ACTXGQ_01500 [Marinobacter sp. 1Y8]
MKKLMLIALVSMLAAGCSSDRKFWDDNGKLEGKTENREVWDSNGKMDQDDRKVWNDSDGKPVVE